MKYLDFLVKNSVLIALLVFSNVVYAQSIRHFDFSSDQKNEFSWLSGSDNVNYDATEGALRVQGLALGLLEDYDVDNFEIKATMKLVGVKGGSGIALNASKINDKFNLYDVRVANTNLSKGKTKISLVKTLDHTAISGGGAEKTMTVKTWYVSGFNFNNEFVLRTVVYKGLLTISVSQTINGSTRSREVCNDYAYNVDAPILGHPGIFSYGFSDLNYSNFSIEALPTPATATTTEIHVSPAGSDSNDGSDMTNAIASFNRVLDRIDEIRKTNFVHIDVVFHSGTYRVLETMKLDATHSGKHGLQVTLKAFGNDEVIFNASTEVAGWTQVAANDLPDALKIHEGKIWKVPFPSAVKQGSLPNTLYRGDERLPRSRKKERYANPFGIGSAKFRTPETAGKVFSASKAEMKSSGVIGDSRFGKNELCAYMNIDPAEWRDWSNVSDIEAMMYTRADWMFEIRSLESIDLINEKASFNVPTAFSTVMSLQSNRHKTASEEKYPDYFLENTLDYMDTQDEWCANSQERMLYLFSDGVPTAVEVPVLAEILLVEGDVEGVDLQEQDVTIIPDEVADIPVYGVRIENLIFEKADRYRWTADDVAIHVSYDLYDVPAAAIRFRGVTDCEITGCEIRNSSGSGIRLDTYAQNCSVTNNFIHHLGRSGISMIGYPLGTKDVNHHNEVTGNHIYKIGMIEYNAMGILAAQSGHNKIQNNKVDHVPFMGIAVLGHWNWNRYNGIAAYRGINIPEWGMIHKKNAMELMAARPESATGAMDNYKHSRYNLVSHNEVSDAARELGDCNAFYTNTSGVGNMFIYNFAHDNDEHGHVGTAFRTDDAAQDVDMSYNIAYNNNGGIAMKHWSNNYSNNMIFNDSTFSKGNDASSGVAPVKLLVVNDEHLSKMQFNNNVICTPNYTTSGWNNYFLPFSNVVSKDTKNPIAKDTYDMLTKMDENVFFIPGVANKAIPILFGGNSVYTNPLFTDPTDYDFSFSENSPLSDWGIVELDASQMGLPSDFPNKFKTYYNDESGSDIPVRIAANTLESYPAYSVYPYLPFDTRFDKDRIEHKAGAGEVIVYNESERCIDIANAQVSEILMGDTVQSWGNYSFSLDIRFPQDDVTNADTGADTDILSVNTNSTDDGKYSMTILRLINYNASRQTANLEVRQVNATGYPISNTTSNIIVATSYPIKFESEGWNTIRFELVNQTIKVFMNGCIAIAEFELPHKLLGYPALKSTTGVSYQIDNISVQELNQLSDDNFDPQKSVLAANHFYIGRPEQLIAMSLNNAVDNGPKIISAGDVYELIADIDFNDMDNAGQVDWNLDGDYSNDAVGYAPINSVSAKADNVEFNGNAYTISNFFINRPTEIRTGLFGDIQDFELRNISFANAAVSGKHNTGTLVGYGAAVAIDNCSSTGLQVVGQYNVGGLVGLLKNGSISKSFTRILTKGNKTVGGLVGLSQTSITIENCFATGAVIGSEKSVGGLVGSLTSNGVMRNVYSAGYVACIPNPLNVGSVVGFVNSGAVCENVYADANNSSWPIYGSGTATGGIQLTTDQFLVASNFALPSNTWFINDGIRPQLVDTIESVHNSQLTLDVNQKLSLDMVSANATHWAYSKDLGDSWTNDVLISDDVLFDSSLGTNYLARAYKKIGDDKVYGDMVSYAGATSITSRSGAVSSKRIASLEGIILYAEGHLILRQLEGNAFNIYNMHGVKVFGGSVIDSEQIENVNLIAGIYIVKCGGLIKKIHVE